MQFLGLEKSTDLYGNGWTICVFDLSVGILDKFTLVDSLLRQSVFRLSALIFAYFANDKRFFFFTNVKSVAFKWRAS